MKLITGAKANYKIFSGQYRQMTRRHHNREDLTKDFAALQNLQGIIHKDIAPEIEQLKKAQEYADSGYKSQLENREELYGKPFDLVDGAFTLHAPGQTVD